MKITVEQTYRILTVFTAFLFGMVCGGVIVIVQMLEAFIK